MITDNKYIDMAYTVSYMHLFEDGRKNQIKAMLHFAELYHESEVKKLKLPSSHDIWTVAREDDHAEFCKWLDSKRQSVVKSACKCENSTWNRDAGCMVCGECGEII
jgi:7-cyano-7-deazaguanine synthase in queuosine biosynthesis